MKKTENKEGTRFEFPICKNKIVVFIYDWWHFGTTTTAKRFVVAFEKPIQIKKFMEMIENGFKEKVCTNIQA